MQYVSVPSGAEGFRLVELVARHAQILFVAKDDVRLEHITQQLSFFLPQADILKFPAWDCLPYDRVSPNVYVVSERLNTLCELLHANPTLKRPLIVVTTVHALMQRVLSKDVLAGTSFQARVGDTIDHDAFTAYLTHNGYVRSGSVTEAGEFAVRGNIIDVFPSGAQDGVRLDLFGDTLESIRSFDPLTQISGGMLDQLQLRPASEIFLNDDTVAAFKHGYRSRFGIVAGDDPLYDAVVDGRKYAGMEHWQPLFYDRMDGLLDYMHSPQVCFDLHANDVFTERRHLIEEYYQVRHDTKESKYGSGTYQALEPDMLYVSADDWQAMQTGALQFTPFDSGTGDTASSRYVGVPFFAHEAKAQSASAFDMLRDYLEQHRLNTLIASHSLGSRERLLKLLNDHDVRATTLHHFSDMDTLPIGTVGVGVLPMERGFRVDAQIQCITEQDLLGEKLVRSAAGRARRKQHIEQFIQEAASLQPGEYVVHRDHGIGRFVGLETLTVQDQQHDFLRLVYAGDDKLFVPVENIELISRYGAEDGVRVDRLGQSQWQERRARMKKRIQIAAEELLRIAAEREVRKGVALEPIRGMYDEFCARFPYPETDDQLQSIEQVEQDLSSGKPMDRLVCGDVGFGKTEVALRAAFIAACNQQSSSVQVVVVAPTTLLCRQHFQTFSERFAGFPVRIRQLSRLVSPKEQKLIREEIREGKVDIVIGTHAVLAKQVTFHQLGLLIIDEEQHFGVAQKERLKALKEEVHVLTLTATPIPRTLQMSLSGIKTLSLIATPPVDRLAVRTYVMPFDPVILREALLREYHRGGRCFYVCPRIKDLAGVHDMLQELVPELKVVKAHGQMAATELDQIVHDFYDGKFDILLSTTIVESGLDVPSANTIIIHRADRFGLAQLYQLRGRVGRSNVRAYAYLTLPPKHVPSTNALKRLEVMQSLDSLGAGFSIASHDMDIRGFGNLVGEAQSGHIREVGVELYQDMLREAVESAKQAHAVTALGNDDAYPTEPFSPQINLGIPVLIPDNYVEDLQVRLNLYRRLTHLTTEQDVEGFAAELFDRFGPLPAEVENLLEVVAIKQRCLHAHVEKVDVGPKGAVFTFHHNHFPAPDALVSYIYDHPHKVKVRADQKFVLMEDFSQLDQRIGSVKKALGILIELIA